MTTTEYLKDMFLSMLTLGRVTYEATWFPQSPELTRDDIHILGNGPSLDNINYETLQGEIMAVNNFAITNYYEKVKPSAYLINAPEYWMSDVDQEYTDASDKLISSILHKTHWPLIFLMPYQARRSSFCKNLSSKPDLIRVYFYNQSAVEGLTSICHILYSLRWGMPRPHNVLIPALMNSIWMGYKKIYIHGADHSWLKEIVVDENNRVFLTQKHFYDARTAKPEVMKRLGRGQRRLHEILEKFFLAFKAYHLINTYATGKNIIIYNCTKESFIDAFPKTSLK